MTLLITCLTPEYAIQVSDRRLTRLDGNTYEDESNKAVFYLPGAVFSYTGLAEIDGVRTDEWLTDILEPGLDLRALIEDVRAKATKRFATIRHSYRHLAIVGAFWVRTGDSHNQAGFCLISNFYGIRPNDGKFGPLPVASDQFQTFISIKPTHIPFSVFGAGQQLTKHQIRTLNRFVQRYLRNTTLGERAFGAKALCRYLSQFIRSVADSNPRVGKSMMQTVLPNPRVPEVAAQAATFSYLSADTNALTIYAPHLVNPSMRIMDATFRRFASDEDFRRHMASLIGAKRSIRRQVM